MKLRKGVEISQDILGTGEEIQKSCGYRMRLRMWLNKGDLIIWPEQPVELQDIVKLSEDRTILIADYRADRSNLITGLFYGIQGMRVHGTRRLKIALHLAYGEKGIEGIIPPNALLIVEVTILKRIY